MTSSRKVPVPTPISSARAIGHQPCRRLGPGIYEENAVQTPTGLSPPQQFVQRAKSARAILNTALR